MSRFFKKRDAVLGKRPGELVYIGKHGTNVLRADTISYTHAGLAEQEGLPADRVPRSAPDGNLWVNVEGISDVPAMEQLESLWDLDPLVAASIMHTGTRPMIMRTGDGIFFLMKMLCYDEDHGRITSEQLSMLITDSRLITFQEAAGDVFDAVRARLGDVNSRLRHSGVDYLAFSLMDSIVDNYMLIIQNIAEAVENIEEKMLERPDETVIPGLFTRISEYAHFPHFSPV